MPPESTTVEINLIENEGATTVRQAPPVTPRPDAATSAHAEHNSHITPNAESSSTPPNGGAHVGAAT